MNDLSRIGVTFATSQADETVIKLADKTISGLLLNNESRNKLESVPSEDTQSAQQPSQPQQLSSLGARSLGDCESPGSHRLFEGGDGAL